MSRKSSGAGSGACTAVSATLIAAMALFVSTIATADESICATGTAECSSFSVGDMRFFGGATSCSPAGAPLPPDPIGTFGSLDGGGGQRQGFGTSGDAVSFSEAAQECLHPIGSASPNGGIICKFLPPTAAEDMQDVFFWLPGLVAGGHQLWN